MNTKLLSLFGLLVVASIMLAACGGAATTTPAPAATGAAATATAPATEAPAQPTAPAGILRIWADETRAPVLQNLADQVLKAYNLQLVVELKASIPDAFQTAAPLGQGPDIIVISHDQAGTLVAKSLLAPVDLGDKAKDFAPQALAACSFDGVLYCLPYATENLGFFYNTDLVQTPPTTWDEVVSMGEALKKDGKVKYIMGVTGTTYDLYPLFTSFGGYIFGKDNKGNWNPQDLGVDSPGMIEGVKWLVDHVKNGDLPADWGGGNNRSLFQSGKVPFIMDGPAQGYHDAGVHYAITNFPGGGYPFASTQGFFINAQSKNLLLALAFLDELIANEDTMLKLYNADKLPPAYLPALAKVNDPDTKAFVEAGKNATMIPTIPAMSFVWSNWNDAVVLARDGKQDPETAMKDAGTKIRALIANPLTGMVNVAGTYQNQVGCGEGEAGNWKPDCDATKMTRGGDGKWHSGPFKVKAGDYEAKVALDGSWTTNYGSDGKQDGPNYKFSLAADGTVEFTFDPDTKMLEIVTK